MPKKILFERGYNNKEYNKEVDCIKQLASFFLYSIIYIKNEVILLAELKKKLMTNLEILNIAMKQSSIDSNCCLDDFKSIENKIVLSCKNSKARKYLALPFYCDLTSYGNNIVASVSKEIYAVVEQYINKYQIEHCFETPNMRVLENELKKYDMCICFMAEYFLPDMDVIKCIECRYETKSLIPTEIYDYYKPEWSNALSIDRKDLDVLAIGAFYNGNLIGLAGCSADSDLMWQIGVDVLPEYRKEGVASALTSQLALEILKKGIVPFYCSAWSNIKSVRNALKSGFKPAWVQMTVKSIEFVNNMNQLILP